MAFAVGDTVTYYSKSQAQEFDATVTAVSPTNGSIQINLKPGVWMAPGDVTAKRPAQGGQGREELLSSGLNDLFIFSKLRQPRSRLYRRQILQINILWKALDEIHKMYILWHRSDIKVSGKKVVIILVKLKN